MNSLTLNALRMNGGKGSGNFGHKGRPGMRGGSGNGKGGSVSAKTKSGDSKASKGSSKLSAEQAKEVTKVGRSLSSTAEDLNRQYSELAHDLGAEETDYIAEFGEDDDFGFNEEVASSRETFEDLEMLTLDLDRVKEKHDSAMSKASTVEEASKVLTATDKAIDGLRDKYDSEMEIAGVVLHPGESLDNIKEEIASAQKALSAKGE